MPSNKNRAGGRPSTYDSERGGEIIFWMQKGRSLYAAADAMGVARQTIHNWMNRYPEFKDAVERAKAARAAVLERELLVTTSSTRGNILRIALVNAAPAEWRTNRPPPKR